MEESTKIPFDLKLAQEGHPVVTDGGQEYVFGSINVLAPQTLAMIGWIKRADGYRLTSHTISGKRFKTGKSVDDLFMRQKESWVNVYRDQDTGQVYTGPCYSSFDDAKEAIKPVTKGYIKTVQLI